MEGLRLNSLILHWFWKEFGGLEAEILHFVWVLEGFWMLLAGTKSESPQSSRIFGRIVKGLRPKSLILHKFLKDL